MQSTYAGGAWGLEWLWGIPMIALSVVVHAVAIALMIIGIAEPIRRRLGKTRSLASSALTFVGLTAGFGFGLALLHVFHALVWAAAYVQLGAIDNFTQALNYSLTTITTLGNDGTAIKPQWQLMGGIEGIAGMLLFGFSTAALFAVLQRFLRLLTQQPKERPL